LERNKPHNELELLQKVSLGEERAFRTLFQAYHGKLGAYVLKLTRSRELTEEIVQETFIKVWAKRASLPEVSDFGSYLFIIARNHGYNVLRDLARNASLHTSLDADQIGDHYENPFEASDPERFFTLLEQAVALLPPQQQRAYLLSRQEGMRHEQIAEQMQLSRETVKRHISLSISSISRYLRDNAGRVSMTLVLFFTKT